ncbi:CD40 ligand, partial [Lamprotornis superbus]
NCKPKGPGPKLSNAEDTLFGDTIMYPQHCLDHFAAAGRTLLRRLESPGELSSKAALGWSGCVGSLQSTSGTQEEGLQQLVSPLEGKTGADLGAGSLFQRDEPYPSLQSCASPGKLKGYMSPKHQPGPQPRAILCPQLLLNCCPQRPWSHPTLVIRRRPSTKPKVPLSAEEHESCAYIRVTVSVQMATCHKTFIHRTHLEEPQQGAQRMNEPYGPEAPRPISSTSPGIMKMFMGFLTVFIVVQTIGTVLFCLYLHMKMDKMEEVLTLNEDYIFLKKVQKCQTAEGQKSTLLDCPEHHEHPHLTHKNETSVAAEKREPIAVHLAGQQSNKAGSVLEWKETMYGPTNSLISNKEGKLKVEEAGLYYIYSQVSFCTREPLAPFTIYIYLHIPKEEDRLLLKGQKTQSTVKSLCELQSIRVGGVFNLREGDMVFVNVTDSTKVKYRHGNTYFGIFKL